jgi:hypothetical protein
MPARYPAAHHPNPATPLVWKTSGLRPVGFVVDDLGRRLVQIGH